MIDLSLIDNRDKILCGLSGGADSIFLVYQLKMLEKEYDIKVFACHLNHETRGLESLRDCNFSKEFCEKIDVPFYYESINISENFDKTLGFEASARKIRYDFFSRALSNFDANKIATAHNADDNLETILMNISRGTGLRGLLGIPKSRDNIIRPILEVSREEIEKFLSEKNISYIIDSSNLTDCYSRNKIRHHCVPILNEINKATIYNATKMCKNLKNDYNFIEKYLEIDYNRIVREKCDNFFIDKQEFLDIHTAISFRILEKILKNFDIALSFDKFNKILMLCNSKNPSASLEIYKNIEIKRNYNDLVICKRIKLEKDFAILVSEDNITITTNNFGKLYCEYFMDFNKIDFDSLYVKTREENDVFKFANHSKSLKKMFIDNKIPRQMRDFIPILCDKNGIVAVLYFGINNDRKEKSNKKVIFRSL